MKILTLFIFASLYFVSIDVQSVRADYKNASSSKTASTSFFEKLEQVDGESTVELRGYQGASFAMMAKYEKDIKKKTSLFKKGVAIIESTILEVPKNPELRLIRLSVQQNSPKIMKYKGEIKQDTEFLLDAYSSIKTVALQKYIKNYFLVSDAFTGAEKSRFKN